MKAQSYATLFFIKYEKGYSRYQLEVFRILFALFALVSIIIVLFDYSSLLAPNGITNWEVSEANCYQFEFHLNHIASALSIAPERFIIGVIISHIICLVFLLVGIFVRFASIVCFILNYMLMNSMTAFGYGVDIYTNICFFLLCFFPIGYEYAVVKRSSYEDLAKIKAICIRCLQLYLSITYIAAGWEKAVYAGWWDGTYIYCVMNDPALSNISNIAAKLPPVFFKLTSWSILVFESLYFIAMWLPIVRSVWLIVMIMLHLYIIFFLSMPLFGLLMIVLNIACWYPSFIKDIRLLKSQNRINYELKSEILSYRI